MNSAIHDFEINAMAAIWLTTLCFVIYRYRGERLMRRLVGDGDIRHQRLVGAFLFAVIPAAILILGRDIDLSKHGLGRPAFHANAVWSASVLLIALPLIYRQSQNEEYWVSYPELRFARWDRNVWVSNAISWGVYLLAYEFLFRGLLLMSLEQWLGPWPAISIMAAMYILSHVDKSKEETFGTIPMSIIFAFAALSTNSIWLPWLMHWTIAVASDSFSVRANPKIDACFDSKS